MGQLNGFGRLISANGDCYIGEFKNDQKHGSGIIFFQNKDIYEGNWFED